MRRNFYWGVLRTVWKVFLKKKNNSTKIACLIFFQAYHIFFSLEIYVEFQIVSIFYGLPRSIIIKSWIWFIIVIKIKMKSDIYSPKKFSKRKLNDNLSSSLCKFHHFVFQKEFFSGKDWWERDKFVRVKTRILNRKKSMQKCNPYVKR